MTFLSVEVLKVDVSWYTAEASLRVLLSNGFRFDFNGLAGLYYRNVTSAQVPNVGIQCLLFVTSTKRWLEAGSINCGISMDWYKRPHGWKADAEKQRKFLDAQDSVTRRISGLRHNGLHGSVSGSNPLYYCAEILMFYISSWVAQYASPSQHLSSDWFRASCEVKRAILRCPGRSKAI